LVDVRGVGLYRIIVLIGKIAGRVEARCMTEDPTGCPGQRVTTMDAVLASVPTDDCLERSSSPARLPFLKTFARPTPPAIAYPDSRRRQAQFGPQDEDGGMSPMCLNCGCGEPETRHKETDITAEDVRKASAGNPVDETIQNMRTSLDKMASGQGSALADRSRSGVASSS
jgi:hypothetical protein